jgi:predicted nucleic acid-binding protein
LHPFLLNVRGQMARALAIGKAFFEGSLVAIHHISEEEARLAWDVFREYADKDWSFLDCSSKLIIDHIGFGACT